MRSRVICKPETVLVAIDGLQNFARYAVQHIAVPGVSTADQKAIITQRLARIDVQMVVRCSYCAITHVSRKWKARI